MTSRGFFSATLWETFDAVASCCLTSIQITSLPPGVNQTLTAQRRRLIDARWELSSVSSTKGEHDVVPAFEVKNPVVSAAEATGNWSSKVRK
jgi:hypothetical protein